MAEGSTPSEGSITTDSSGGGGEGGGGEGGGGDGGAGGEGDSGEEGGGDVDGGGCDIRKSALLEPSAFAVISPLHAGSSIRREPPNWS